MSVLNSLSIRFKILLIVGIAVLGFVINFTFNYSVTSNNSVRLKNVRNVYYPILEKVDDNQVRLGAIIEILKAAVNSEDEDMVEDADKFASEMQAAFLAIGKLDQKDLNLSKNLNKLFKDYYQSAKSFTVASLEGSLDKSKIKSTIDNMLSKKKALSLALDDFRKMKYQMFVGTLDEANASSQFALNLGLIISLIVILVVTLFGYVISNIIAKNISHVVYSLKEMASGEGDLTQRLKTTSSDEIGVLVTQFNRFVEKLQLIISNINNSTVLLASAAEEMSLVSAESSKNMSRQTMETEQVATAMNEMTATVQEVTNSAQTAASSAVEASSAADNGQQIVGKTVSAINTLAGEVEHAASVISRLEKDTETIGGVLDVIRGISEQTNLLALNAAIEAARAGEQGRGFAVVADEVRTLAGRTQDSTTEIQSMIESLQSGAAEAVKVMGNGEEKAKDGVEQAAQAGAALQEINGAVSSIRDMNMHIASAAEEQGNVAEEINRNIHTINEIGVQTTQSAEQAAHASQEISNLANELQQEVGQFKV